MPIRAPVAVAVAAIAVLGAACHQSAPAGAGGEAGADVTAAAAGGAATNGRWRSLLDGNSLAAWRGYRSDSVPPGWAVADGILSKRGPVGDLVTRDVFGDFELTLEWRISRGGNAGIFYRGTEEYDHIYWTAPEYQLLDDAVHADGKNPLTRAATDYALYPRVAGAPKPVGEWNTTRLVVRGAHVEHWLNGAMAVSYELWSPDWKAKVAASKFTDWRDYGMAKSGHIALQGDHTGTLAFRNIRIRTLP